MIRAVRSVILFQLRMKVQSKLYQSSLWSRSFPGSRRDSADMDCTEFPAQFCTLAEVLT